MKKIISSVILALALCLPLCAQSQTTNSAPAEFYQSVASFFTSFNTNLPSQSTVQIWTGTANVGNQRMEAEFGMSLHPAALKGFAVEAILRNDVALGSLASAQGGVAYHYNYLDVDLAAYLHAGYDYHAAAGYAAPGLRALKMLTPNTYSGVSLELPVSFHGQANLTPTYGIELGFTI